MDIKVTKVTSTDLIQWACGITIDKETNIKVEEIYRNEHSPMRTQMFCIEMLGIPSFVSTHFVRHSQGVTHFVSTKRDDRGGDGTEDRNTPVNHGMFINAQALINIARKRLCHKSHKATRAVMERIVDEMLYADSELYDFLVPECYYRNGCNEKKSCGLYDKWIR